MRGRLLVVAAATLLVAIYLLRTVGGSGGSERPSESARATPPAVALAEPAAAPAAPLRNVFEYSAGTMPSAPEAGAARIPAAPVAAAAMAPLPSPSPLVRLVGLLRRGAQIKAALAIVGETVVLGPGESAAGYTVVSIDEDEGVRLRTPDGATILLVAASQQ